MKIPGISSNDFFFVFSIANRTKQDFLSFWSGLYKNEDEWKYLDNIGRALNSERIRLLYEWKNGGKIAAKKLQSVRKNYPYRPPPNLEERYLNPKQPGGPIWNIFYLHLNDRTRWPIFDQHAYRTMIFLEERKLDELDGKRKEDVLKIYKERYIPFFRSFDGGNPKIRDQAFFCCGRFLKDTRLYLNATVQA